MTAPASAPATAKILHLAICSGLMLFIAVAYYVSQHRPPNELPAIVLYLPLVAGAVMFGTALVLRRKLLDGGPAMGDEWYRANLQRMILLWALFEAPALFGTVLYLVSGAWIPLVATGVGLVLLVLHSPDQLRPQ